MRASTVISLLVGLYATKSIATAGKNITSSRYTEYTVSVGDEETVNKCSGVLIRQGGVQPSYLLTSASCVSGIKTEDLRLLIGHRDLSTSYNRYEAAEVIPHPDYNPKTHHHDIAIVHLKKCLCSKVGTFLPAKPESTDRYKVLGWGDAKDSSHTWIHRADAAYMDPTECGVDANDKTRHCGHAAKGVAEQVVFEKDVGGPAGELQVSYIVSSLGKLDKGGHYFVVTDIWEHIGWIGENKPKQAHDDDDDDDVPLSAEDGHQQEFHVDI